MLKLESRVLQSTSVVFLIYAFPPWFLRISRGCSYTSADKLREKQLQAIYDKYIGKRKNSFCTMRNKSNNMRVIKAQMVCSLEPNPCCDHFHQRQSRPSPHAAHRKSPKICRGIHWQPLRP
jgi:hypothetical protein